LISQEGCACFHVIINVRRHLIPAQATYQEFRVMLRNIQPAKSEFDLAGDVKQLYNYITS
jgi:hypothetical protein